MINEDNKNIILILFFKKNAKIPEGEPKAKAEKKKGTSNCTNLFGAFCQFRSRRFFICELGIARKRIVNLGLGCQMTAKKATWRLSNRHQTSILAPL